MISSSRDSRSGADIPRIRLIAGPLLLAATFLAGPAISAQTMNRISQKVDVSRVQALPEHHPLWANAANSIGLAPADLPLNQLTLVLARTPEKQQAFDQFVADQQNPTSPNFHHWLTPAEVGDRFGLSDQDIATLTGWLQSQGLQVNWVAPSRVFIGFGGTAENIGRAFQTEMQYYNVQGEQKLSVSSDPMLPAALVPAIKGVRGLFTIDERPTHRVSDVQTASPQLTVGSPAVHYVTPADFNLIYDVPTAYTGAGKTIGIVSWSRINSADIDNFKAKSGVSFTSPTEVIPTAFGGIDPGPALTTPPSGNSSALGGQEEATLDVLRAGSVAPGANLLLVISSKNDGNDGIGTDAQYLVGTSPVPAQVMSISFGACESSAGAGNVAFWDNLFQTAASEGISVFVSSGDSGAAGCDVAFSAPPASPRANSPNYICSSSYATCVGGTQFADTASPSTYWSSTNGAGYKSALGYIPEGAWNESTSTSVAGTGGGVSTVIATPTWQTGTGVPAARAGRYTPDVSFTASTHDGYFACMAAISGGGCVTSNGSFGFVIFSGTSASAPGMAGVAALLDQKLGGAQGNLNPQIYSLAASAPPSYHDTTEDSSGIGVSACSASTVSICNNSVPNLTTGAQAGFKVGTGYDEATGLGSLDVATFLNNYNAGPPPPTATSGTASAITVNSATLGGTVNPNGLDTHVWFLYGTDNLLSGASQTASQDIGSGSTATAVSANLSGLTANTPYFFQVVAQSSAGTSAGAIQTFTTSSVAKTTPTITWATPAAINYGTALSATQLNATATVASVPVAGTFVYTPAAGAVPSAGSRVLSVTFTPTDTTTYNSASGTVTLTVNKVTPTVTWGTPAAIAYGTALSGTQLSATASVAGAFVYSPAAGTVLTAGPHALSVNFTPTDTTDYNTPAASSVQLTVNKATPVITWTNPASVLAGTALSATQLNATSTVPGTFVYTPPLGTVTAVGSTTLSTTLTPTDTTNYNTASTSVTLTVTPYAVSGSAATLTAGTSTGNTSTITVTPGTGFTGSVALSAAVAGPAGAVHLPTVTFTTSPVTVSSATAVTTTMTIATTASSTTPCVAANEAPTGIPWYAKGGAVLACVLLFGIAPKRRKWRTMLGALMLLVALAGGMVACGGSKSSSCTPTTTPGTTAGSYTITVTGTSGTSTATGTVALTVN